MQTGDQLYPVYASANVDPNAFAEPLEFKIDRKPNHFAFGRGIHQCAGAPLARMQMRVLVEEMLRVTTTFGLEDGAARKAWPNNGFERLVIRMR